MNTVKSKMKLFAIAFAALLTSACASSVKSTIDTAENVNLGEYETYAWISDTPYVSEETTRSQLINPLNYQRVRAGIDAELTEKGYRQVSLDKADLVLGVTLGERDTVRVRHYYNDFGYRYYGVNRFNRFSRFSRFDRFGRYNRFRNSFGPVVTTEVRKVTEGSVAVDVFDSQLREPIWHGLATKSLTGDAMGEKLIAEAVDALIGPIPARTPTVATAVDSTSSGAGAH